MLLFFVQDYHVHNFVCRPDSRPGGPLPKGRRAKSEDDNIGNVRKKYNRFRGAEGDRTCPNCKRVFTSVLGLNYHKGETLAFCLDYS
jgi:hypothetical protein